ncbi:AMP-dependent synthetase and ligase domain protein [Mycobacterium xenopi 4042]|uniref:AMP-dependent synthetase and ligase domain protein n=1 Tax=Mycobacterium xenopi 4042 TaxID=1299334 RepID=X8AHI0_MYCXE|nr:AMP-dependent synthetase and ligase domain protein [Mycobacterium xenopi 4042]
MTLGDIVTDNAAGFPMCPPTGRAGGCLPIETCANVPYAWCRR